MKVIQKVNLSNGQTRIREVEAGSFKELQDELHLRFYMEDEVARYEEVKFENGTQSVSLKDAGNKIIIQYKTIL